MRNKEYLEYLKRETGYVITVWSCKKLGAATIAENPRNENGRPAQVVVLPPKRPPQLSEQDPPQHQADPARKSHRRSQSRARECCLSSKPRRTAK